MNFFTVAIKKQSLRTGGIASLLELCSHVTSKAIPLGPQVLRPARNGHFSLLFLLRGLPWLIDGIEMFSRSAVPSEVDNIVFQGKLKGREPGGSQWIK